MKIVSKTSISISQSIAGHRPLTNYARTQRMHIVRNRVLKFAYPKTFEQQRIMTKKVINTDRFNMSYIFKKSRLPLNMSAKSTVILNVMSAM